VRVRSLLILGTMVLGVMLLGGVALAVNKSCTTKPCVGTNGKDVLRGNQRANQIYGIGGADFIRGKAGIDELYGGRGNDTVRGGPQSDRISGGFGSDDLFGGGGNDTISAADGYKDVVNCGFGNDRAYVDKRDRVNEDCEDVRRSGGTPSDNYDVYGTGRLGAEFGSPQLRVSANSTGKSPNDVQGQFSINYPDDTKVRGTILCLAVTGNEARLVGRINSASGPREQNDTFVENEYVRIGLLDNDGNDQANFSPSEKTFTSCNGENPNLDVVKGNYVVRDV
jgi:Ca2+-binding RTX toxin-like protein